MDHITEFHPPHGGWTGTHEVCLDFSANLNPLGMPACVKQAVTAAADAWAYYPDPYCSSLRAQLSALTGLSPAQIAAGAGAEELIFRIVSAYRPKKALLAVPTFSEYEKALRQAGCEVSFFALRRENLFDITEEFMSTITDDTDMVFLCNPNNPTGRLTDPVLLEAIARRCAACGAVLVVDESFLPFVPDAASLSILQLLRDEAVSAHLILLSSFTKYFAVPGLRLGFCICGSTDAAQRIRDAGPFWSVSAPALAAGEAVLTDPGLEKYANRTAALISRERGVLEGGLREAGITVIPSRANFLLCRSDAAVYEQLLSQGILVRDCANFRALAAGWFRIAVRTHAENEALLKALGR